MKRYEECKDSGVQWIGDVPNHWNYSRIKFGLKSSFSGVWGEDEKEDENDVVCYRVADFDYKNGGLSEEKITIRNIDEKTFREREVLLNDILIEKSGGGDVNPVGRAVIVNLDHKATCSNFMHCVRCNENVLNNRLLYYFFYSIYAQKMNLLFFNQTTGIQNLKVPEYLGQVMFLPPLSEQQSIASFLDAKTKPIDNIISKREKQIELLEEVKSTIIRRAVTKGLNPNAKMKDSGIEWIGEIPEGWEAADLKRYAKISTGKTPSTKYDEYFENEEVVWFTPGDFPDNGILLKDSSRKIDKRAIEANEAFLYPERSVYLVGIGGTLGKVGIFKDKASCNQQINIIICKANVCKKFVAYYLYSKKEILKVFSNAATLPILNQEKTGYIKIVMPPMEEQQAVASYLDSETSKLDARIAKRHKQIELLQEYKQALITDAVTGKIDVRENSCQ